MIPPYPFGDEDCRRVYNLSKQDSRLGRKVREALGVIEEALRRYGRDAIAFSFNGGKDCTVLLHLLATTLSTTSWLEPNGSSIDDGLKKSDTSPAFDSNLSRNIKTVYVRCDSPFPQVEEFVHACITRYSLDLVRVTGPMKSSLDEYLQILERRTSEAPPSKGLSPVKAILVGTRRGDPHGAELKHLTPTDAGWPQFMRVHPILDWSYHDIWDFLRYPSLAPQAWDGMGIGWCGLYDYGYTSLGSTYNTSPNPRLQDDSAASGAAWRPAWELDDETQERAGRASRNETK